MISCQQARHLFDAFLDDELSPAMRTELHTHRLSCPDCSRELAVLEACADVVRTDLREPVLHEDFTDRMMVAFAGRRAVPTYRWRRIAVFAGSPLAAAAVLVFAFTAGFHNPVPQQHRFKAVAEAVPEPIRTDMLIRANRTLTPAEQSEIARMEQLQTKDVLAAWLTPAVERANNTFSQTQQSVSQLAQFVRLGIFPPEMLRMAENKQLPRDTASQNDDLLGPRFDMQGPGGEHSDQPESTDKTATDEIEVM